MNREDDIKNDLTAAETQADDTPAEEEKETVRPATSTATKFSLFIVFLLALGGLAGTAYLYTLYTGLNEQITKYSSTDVSGDKLRAELMDRQQTLQRNLARLQEDMLNLKKSVKQIYMQTENSGESWSITETKHLLQLAVDQLELARDIDGAMAALSLADSRITSSGDPALQKVRQQIARDIASLQQIERVDLAGTLNRLQAIEQSIDNLPLTGQSQKTEKNEASVEKATEKASEAETSIWQQVSSDLSSLVTIRRIDGPAMPILSPDQHDYLRQNIKALILSARISFLRDDRKSYRDSLNQAARWVANYFDAGHRSTSWIIDELDSLAAIAPSPALPDISGSLASLEQVMKEKQ